MNESSRLPDDAGTRMERKLYNFEKRYEDYKGKAIRTTNLYCVCGHPLRVKDTWDGTDWERTFYETDHEIPLVSCPSCRIDLSRADLKLSGPPRKVR
jgi:hypothetical protein